MVLMKVKTGGYRALKGTKGVLKRARQVFFALFFKPGFQVIMQRNKLSIATNPERITAIAAKPILFIKFTRKSFAY